MFRQILLISVVILAPKTGALQVVPVEQNGSLLENSSYYFDYISVINGNRRPK
jgi:hypothetical protein